MQQRLTIRHAVPKQMAYTGRGLIGVPRLDAFEGDLVNLKPPYVTINLEDPFTEVSTIVEVRGMLRFHFKDEYEAGLCSFHADLAYCLTGRQLFNALKKRQPMFNGAIDFLLLGIHEPINETK